MLARLLFILLAVFIFIFPAVSYAQEADYDPNSILVQFKSGRSIDQLIIKSNERRSRDQNWFGKIQNSWDDLLGREDPEVELNQIRQLNRENSVSSAEKLISLPLPSDGTQIQSDARGDVYLIRFDSDRSAQDLVNEYKSSSAVQTAELNHKTTAAEFPNDPMFKSQWNLVDIQMDEVWPIENSANKSVIVGIMDTGVALNHPDLPPPILNFNSTNKPNLIEDGNGHGTHVAGIINAYTNNELGVSSLRGSNNVQIQSYMVLEPNGGGFVSYMLTAIDKVLSLPESERPRIINFSLIVSYDDKIFEQAIKELQAEGILIVAAAGNNGWDKPAWPAVYPGVIGVGAVNQYNNRASFSTYGQAASIYAPGVDIFSTFLNAGYLSKEGTSMASPHVAGLAAALLAIFPNLTNDQIKESIINSGLPISDIPEDPGKKRINASATYRYARNNFVDQATKVTVGDQELDLTGARSSMYSLGNLVSILLPVNITRMGLNSSNFAIKVIYTPPTNEEGRDASDYGLIARCENDGSVVATWNQADEIPKEYRVVIDDCTDSKVISQCEAGKAVAGSFYNSSDVSKIPIKLNEVTPDANAQIDRQFIATKNRYYVAQLFSRNLDKTNHQPVAGATTTPFTCQSGKPDYHGQQTTDYSAYQLQVSCQSDGSINTIWTKQEDKRYRVVVYDCTDTPDPKECARGQIVGATEYTGLDLSTDRPGRIAEALIDGNTKRLAGTGNFPGDSSYNLFYTRPGHVYSVQLFDRNQDNSNPRPVPGISVDLVRCR